MAAVVVAGVRHAIDRELTIGRGVTVGLRLKMTDATHYISRLHARIRVGPPTFEDLSNEGSYVNGVHVFGRTVPLADGDRIRIGDHELVFVIS